MPLHESAGQQIRELDPNPSPEQAAQREHRRTVAAKMSLLLVGGQAIPSRWPSSLQLHRTVHAYAKNPQTGQHTKAYIEGISDDTHARAWLALETYKPRQIRAPRATLSILAESKDNDLNFMWYRAAYDDEELLPIDYQKSQLTVVSHFVDAIASRAQRERRVAIENPFSPKALTASEQSPQIVGARRPSAFADQQPLPHAMTPKLAVYTPLLPDSI